MLDLLDNTVLLFALTLLYEINQRFWMGWRQPVPPWWKQATSGLIFGGICMIGLAHAQAVAPGILLDARSAILSMAAFFGGPLVGGIATLLACAYRLWLGGDGVPAGLLIMVSSMGLGLAFRHAVARRGMRLTALRFFQFASVLQLVAVFWVLLLTVETLGPGLAGVMAAAYLIVLTPATALLGLLLQYLEKQRHIAQALSESEALRRAITRASPDVLLLLDEEGRYLEVISPEERLLYAKAEDLVGQRLSDVLPAPQARRFLDFVRSVIDSEMPRHIEYSLDTLGGHCVFEGRGQVLDRQIQGKRAMVFMARDITDRVAAEQERRVAAIAFESQQGMFITDAQGVILRANQACTQLLGYSHEDLVGQHTRILRSGRHDAAFYQALWQSVGNTGKWEGEVWDRCKDGRVLPLWITISAVRDAQGAISHHVACMADMTLRKAQEEEILKLALYDQLTAVPNRRLLLDRLQHALGQAQRSGLHGALMFIDLDGFKQINDRFGHRAGDVLLQQVAQRLSSVVRSTDTVARLGGDEFVLLVEQLQGGPDQAMAEALQIGAKALRVLAEPIDLGEQSGCISGSMGIALLDGQAIALDELLRRADAAMYAAKSQGKNTIRCYESPAPPLSEDRRA
ncbi:MAG: diguanylate cyclase [Burkholderiaceae bacterium]|nr:diguanylate cyclase [Burkholderiaceae bacterium]